MNGKMPEQTALGDASDRSSSAGACEPLVFNELFPAVYSELRRMAAHALRGQRPGHTLQPTALLHEAYIRLATRNRPEWRDRSHFMAVASMVMRQILVDQARRKHALKRSRSVTFALASGAARTGPITVDLIELDRALQALEAFDQRKARVLDLRIFGGLDLQETADALGISIPTVTREARLAQAWLMRELAAGPA